MFQGIAIAEKFINIRYCAHGLRLKSAPIIELILIQLMNKIEVWFKIND